MARPKHVKWAGCSPWTTAASGRPRNPGPACPPPRSPRPPGWPPHRDRHHPGGTRSGRDRAPAAAPAPPGPAHARPAAARRAGRGGRLRLRGGAAGGVRVPAPPRLPASQHPRGLGRGCSGARAEPLRYLERLFSHDVAFRVLADVRVAIYRRLERLAPAGLAGLAGFRSGDLLTRLISDVDATQDLFIRGIAPPLTAALVGAGATTAVLLILAPAAGLLAVGLLAAGAGVPWLTAACASRAARRAAPARGALGAAGRAGKRRPGEKRPSSW